MIDSDDITQVGPVAVARVNRCCPHETHLKLKETVNGFLAGVTGVETWGGLLTGQCAAPGCSSTLALHLCVYCRFPCPSRDSIHVPDSVDDDRCHVRCLVEAEFAKGRQKFVIVVANGTAREFSRDGFSVGGER